MGVVDIDQLHHETAAILRRVREEAETIAISEDGEIVARLSPVASAPSRPETGGEPEPADPGAEHAAMWAELNRIGRRFSASWPPGLTAVDAVREGRDRLDEDPPTRRAHIQASLDRLKRIGEEISETVSLAPDETTPAQRDATDLETWDRLMRHGEEIGRTPPTL